MSYDNAEFVFGEPVVDTTGVDPVATVTFTNFFGATGTIVYTLSLDGDDYKIRKIVMTLDADEETQYVLEFFGTRRS